MSGIPLGIPLKNISKSQKKQAQSDERIRNSIEGKFGEAKRRFSLSKVMAKLSNTSETGIAITFMVMNLSAQGYFILNISLSMLQLKPARR